MKQICILLFLGILFFQTAYSQENPFPHLKELKTNEGYCAIYYDASKATVIDKSYDELDKNHPAYEYMYADMRLLLSMPIDGKTQYFAFSPGPSADPAFFILNAAECESPERSDYLSCLHFYLNSNGLCYTDGHVNSYFDERKKWKIVDGCFEEVKQPYYYVGIETKTGEAVTLLDKIDGKEVIARLPKDYEIEILVAERTENTKWFLIRTKFGLTGWVERNSCYLLGCNLGNLIFAGD